MKLRVLLLVVLFLLIFFVNIPALFQPCNWRVQCPDYVGVKVVGWYPNFYIPQRIGGFAGMTYPARWSIGMLVSDVITYSILAIILTKFKKHD